MGGWEVQYLGAIKPIVSGFNGIQEAMKNNVGFWKRKYYDKALPRADAVFSNVLNRL